MLVVSDSVLLCSLEVHNAFVINMLLFCATTAAVADTYCCECFKRANMTDDSTHEARFAVEDSRSLHRSHASHAGVLFVFAVLVAALIAVPIWITCCCCEHVSVAEVAFYLLTQCHCHWKVFEWVEWWLLLLLL